MRLSLDGSETVLQTHRGHLHVLLAVRELEFVVSHSITAAHCGVNAQRPHAVRHAKAIFLARLHAQAAGAGGAVRP